MGCDIYEGAAGVATVGCARAGAAVGRSAGGDPGGVFASKEGSVLTIDTRKGVSS
jgi:hypothetical protein